jgi:hypothetical protein
VATEQIGAIKPPGFNEDAVSHRRQIVDYVRAAGDRANATLPKDGNESMTGPLKLSQYTESTPSDTRPTAAAEEGDVIYASDVGKAQLWTGAAWENMN